MARAIIDDNKYVTLATADRTGKPWASPVYYTPDGYRQFYWASSPESVHSRNIAERPSVGMVVFDSQVPIGGAQAVYLAADVEVVADHDLERCAALYGSRFADLRVYTADQLRPPAPLRLYRATVTEHSVLVRGSDPVYGRGVDSRIVVTL